MLCMLMGRVIGACCGSAASGVAGSWQAAPCTGGPEQSGVPSTHLLQPHLQPLDGGCIGTLRPGRQGQRSRAEGNVMQGDWWWAKAAAAQLTGRVSSVLTSVVHWVVS
jgi:hypothetical protein